MASAEELRGVLHDVRKEVTAAIMRLERLENVVFAHGDQRSIERATRHAHQVLEAGKELRCVIDGLVETDDLLPIATEGFRPASD